MPHSWKRGTVVYPHVHWTKTTDAGGDVIWEYAYKVIKDGTIAPAWSAWIGRAYRSFVLGATQTTMMDIFPALVIGESGLSSIVVVKVRRNVNALEDNYSADAKWWEFDMHVLSDSRGSSLPTVKDEAGI